MRLIRRALPFLILGAVLLLVEACAASQPRFTLPIGVSDAPGFWKGLWHGFIAPIAFLVSLFSDTVRMYAYPNAGRWYDFGFMLGIGGFSGGILAGSRARK